jgi:hypothetical protein
MPASYDPSVTTHNTIAELIVQLRESTTATEREPLYQQLIALGEGSRDVLPLLLRHAEEGSHGAQPALLAILQRCGDDIELIGPLLRRRLDSPHAETRRVACIALRELLRAPLQATASHLANETQRALQRLFHSVRSGYELPTDTTTLRELVLDPVRLEIPNLPTAPHEPTPGADAGERYVSEGRQSATPWLDPISAPTPPHTTERVSVRAEDEFDHRGPQRRAANPLDHQAPIRRALVRDAQRQLARARALESKPATLGRSTAQLSASRPLPALRSFDIQARCQLEPARPLERRAESSESRLAQHFTRPLAELLADSDLLATLHAAGITQLELLLDLREHDLNRLIGQAALQRLQSALARHGLTLAPQLPHRDPTSVKPLKPRGSVLKKADTQEPVTTRHAAPVTAGMDLKPKPLLLKDFNTAADVDEDALADEIEKGGLVRFEEPLYARKSAPARGRVGTNDQVDLRRYEALAPGSAYGGRSTAVGQGPTADQRLRALTATIAEKAKQTATPPMDPRSMTTASPPPVAATVRYRDHEIPYRSQSATEAAISRQAGRPGPLERLFASSRELLAMMATIHGLRFVPLIHAADLVAQAVTGYLAGISRAWKQLEADARARARQGNEVAALATELAAIRYQLGRLFALPGFIGPASPLRDDSQLASGRRTTATFALELVCSLRERLDRLDRDLAQLSPQLRRIEHQQTAAALVASLIPNPSSLLRDLSDLALLMRLDHPRETVLEIIADMLLAVRQVLFLVTIEAGQGTSAADGLNQLLETSFPLSAAELALLRRLGLVERPRPAGDLDEAITTARERIMRLIQLLVYPRRAADPRRWSEHDLVCEAALGEAHPLIDVLLERWVRSTIDRLLARHHATLPAHETHQRQREQTLLNYRYALACEIFALGY